MKKIVFIALVVAFLPWQGSAADFHLRAPLPGVCLPPPYDRDMDGNKRGADGECDIGAYEFDRNKPRVPTIPDNVIIKEQS